MNLGMFIAAGLLLNITPGPDMLYIVARSATQGRAAGVMSALGIGAGCLIHIFAVALGLAQFLRTVPAAYDAIRWAGAAYLIYLGIRTFMPAGTAAQRRLTASAFRQGALTNILNPKVALFFLAFLPQFLDRNQPPFRQTLKLGLIFDFNGTLVNLAVALLAGTLGTFKASPFRYVTGTIFLGLGIRLAVSGVR